MNRSVINFVAFSILIYVTHANIIKDSVKIPAGGSDGTFFQIIDVTGPSIVTFDITSIGGANSGKFTTLTISDSSLTALYNNPGKCGSTVSCMYVEGTRFEDVARATGNNIPVPSGKWHVIVINNNVIYPITISYNYEASSVPIDDGTNKDKDKDNDNALGVLFILFSCCLCGGFVVYYFFKRQQPQVEKVILPGYSQV